MLFATVCQPGSDGGVVQPLVSLAGQLCGQMVTSKIAMQRIVVGLFLSFWATFGTVSDTHTVNSPCQSLIWLNVVHE